MSRETNREEPQGVDANHFLGPALSNNVARAWLDEPHVNTPDTQTRSQPSSRSAHLGVSLVPP